MHIDQVKKIRRWEDIEKTDENFLAELTPEEKSLVLRNGEIMDEFEKKTIERLVRDYGCMVVAKLTPAISKILSYRNSLNVIRRGHIVKGERFRQNPLKRYQNSIRSYIY